MRYCILADPNELAAVAACWPLASIEKIALWVYDATDQTAAEWFAEERFPCRQFVVMALPEAESVVRQHLANIVGAEPVMRSRRRKHLPGRTA